MAEIDFSKKVFECVNKLRSNPKSFIPILKKDLQFFDGNVLELPDKVPAELEEGSLSVSQNF
jgi:hypothetical protein